MAIFLTSVVLAALAVLTMIGVTIPASSGNAVLLRRIAYTIPFFGVLFEGA